MRGSSWATLLTVCLVNTAHAQWRWPMWIDDLVIKRVDLSGSRTLGFHAVEVSGDTEAFNQLTYYGQGSKRFTDFGRIRLVGRRVFNLLDFDMQLDDNRYRDPQAQTFTFRHRSKGWDVAYGDVFASVGGNPYAGFSKSLRGATLSYQSKGFSIQAVRSESRGSARTITIQGTNAAGPYYLQSSEIVRNSEQVRVDGQDMLIDRDYVIDYDLGSITFVGRIIPPSSTIAVSYEAFGFNAQPGIIQGAAVGWDMGKFGRIGVSALQQISRSGSGVNSRLEKFQGFGSPSTPYFLQFEPLPGRPITIRLDGVLQVEGVDYRFDAGNPSIFYFTRFIPSTSTIDVVYFPRPRETADGDREVIGLTYRLPLGRRGGVSYYQATGRLKSDVAPLKGTARGARLDYRSGPLTLSSQLADVPSTFVGIESRGFSRNERLWESTMRYSGKNAMQYGISHSNSAVTLRSRDSSGNLFFRGSRFTSVSGFVRSEQPPSKGTWGAEHRRTASSQAGAGTTVDWSALSWAKQIRDLSVRLAYERSAATGPVSGGTAGQRASVQTNTGRMTLGYTRGPWSLDGAFGLSRVSTSGESGTGRDITANVLFNPSDRFSANLSYLQSNSGSLAALSQISNGYGLGYDGNGFSGGPVTTTPNGDTDLRRLGLSASYFPSERIELAGRIYHSRSTGSITSNTQTVSFGGEARFDFGRSNSLSLSVDRSRTSFIDSPETATATSFGFLLETQPFPLVNLNLGLNLFDSSGGIGFAQTSGTFEASLSYRFMPRHSLTASFVSGRTRGYYPQNDWSFALIHRYQIWRTLALVTSYNLRDVRNLDPGITSGAYRSKGLHIELAFSF